MNEIKENLEIIKKKFDEKLWSFYLFDKHIEDMCFNINYNYVDNEKIKLEVGEKYRVLPKIGDPKDFGIMDAVMRFTMENPKFWPHVAYAKDVFLVAILRFEENHVFTDCVDANRQVYERKFPYDIFIDHLVGLNHSASTEFKGLLK